MDTHIRLAHLDDLPDLVRLLGDLFSIEADFRPDPDRQRTGLALMLADQHQRAILVAERDGEIVGMVTAQLVVSTAEGGRSALIEDMIVDRSCRGQGIGSALLYEIETWASARGAVRLQLLADRENAAAFGFYEHMGWRGTRMICLRRGGT